MGRTPIHPKGGNPPPRKYLCNATPGTIPAPSFPTTINLTKKSKPRTAHSERLEAARIALLKKKVKATGARSDIPEALWVHVGNLDPMANEVTLAAHFSMCGPVEYVNIRYSSTGRPGNPSAGYTYAIVKFTERGSVERAAAATGSSLHGSKYRMIVSPELLTLPEVQRLPEFRQMRREEPMTTKGIPKPPFITVDLATGVFLTAAGAAKTPTVCDRTKVWKDPRPGRRSGGRKIRVGGYTFKLTLA